MIYRLERKVGGEWYKWGNYTDPVRLAAAAHELGKLGFEEIRVLAHEKG
jgi:hypothetical protein